MAPKGEKKRLGKKHRSATTRPKQGKGPSTGARKKTEGKLAAAAPKQRKAVGNEQAKAKRAALLPKQSPELEHRVIVGREDERPTRTARRAEQADREALHAAAKAVEVALVIGDHHTPTRLPLVAICGRPNVGKSTLFNRLTGSRRSIVGDEPGITRDRIYGEVDWAGRTVRVVDTGGVIPDDEALIPAEIFRQARVALEEADAIVMVIDGRTEITAADIELARLLQRSGGARASEQPQRTLFLAVNKMDTAQLESSAENFRTLGFKNVMPVSAEHGSGIGDLLDEVWAALPPEFVAEEPEEVIEGEDDEAEEHMGPDEGTGRGAQDAEDEDFEEDGEALAEVPANPEAFVDDDEDLEADPDQNDPEKPRPRTLRSHGETVLRETKIAIIGKPNVGKSTLLNALTGTERAIVSPIAGTTRDAVDEVVTRDGHDFRFIDTAGIRRKGKTKLMAEKLSVIMSRKHLEEADVALLVIDASEGVTAADATIGGYAHESGRSVIIIVNKWDLMTTKRDDSKPKADQKIFEEQVRDHLKFLDYAPVVFVSAAESKNIDQVFKKVELVSRERRKRITTGNMNRFLDRIDFGRASVPMNRRIRIYYMTQAAVAPPTFVLFTDKDVKLHFSYERFLANEVRKAFKFIGSPIWFKIKARNKKKEE